MTCPRAAPLSILINRITGYNDLQVLDESARAGSVSSMESITHTVLQMCLTFLPMAFDALCHMGYYALLSFSQGSTARRSSSPVLTPVSAQNTSD